MAAKKTPSKKSPTKRKKGPGKTAGKKGAGGHQLKLLLAVLFLLAFVVLSLVLLSQLRETLPKTATAPQGVAVPPVIQAPRAAEPRTATREEVRAELELYLLERKDAAAGLQTRREGDLFSYRVSGAFPDADWFEALRQHLATLSDQARLIPHSGPGEFAVEWQGQPAFRVSFEPQQNHAATPGKIPAKERPAPRPALPPEPLPFAGRAKVAIIMDDLGQDTASAKALLAIDLPVTFAILPWNDQASRVAEMAHRGGRQVLIHIPMEPQGYPAVNPGKDALLVDLGADEIRRRFAEYRQRVPHAVGGNNHMGSRFTERREQMAVVIEALKEADLFFVDSVTSGASVAFDEARRAGVPAARRDRFLDNVQDVEKIALEIRKLARLAARQGTAVGICHPYPQTLAALRREAGIFRQEGVEVVPVSELLIR